MNVQNLLNSLPIMGYGMTGIFVVTGVIIGVVYLLKLIPDSKEKSEKMRKASGSVSSGGFLHIKSVCFALFPCKM